MNTRALKTNLSPAQGMRRSHMMVVFDEPIVAQRWAVMATGSITAAVMISYALQLSQALQKQNDGWFAKTIKEWQEEAGLSRSEQETARARLLELGLLKERRKGMPARLEYRVDEDRVYALVDELASESYGHLDAREQAPVPEAGVKGKKRARPGRAFPPDYQPL